MSLSQSDWITILGFLPLAIALLDLIEKKAIKPIKIILSLAVGIAILAININKNKSDKKSQQSNYSKVSRMDSTIGNLSFENKNLKNNLENANQKLDTLIDYLRRMDSLGIRRNEKTNTPVITKRFTNYIKHIDTMIQQ